MKRLRRKRDSRKKANIRLLGLRNHTKLTLGSDKMADRMIHNHQDVLQNIEFALVSGYRDNNDIDDCVIAEALKAAIGLEEPEGELSLLLKQELDGVRLIRSDVTDEIWRDGLRTVLQSVHNHSDLRPGSMGYLNFISLFIV